MRRSMTLVRARSWGRRKVRRDARLVHRIRRRFSPLESCYGSAAHTCRLVPAGAPYGPEAGVPSGTMAESKRKRVEEIFG